MALAECSIPFFRSDGLEEKASSGVFLASGACSVLKDPLERPKAL